MQRAAVVDDKIRVLKERLIIQEVERKRSEQNISKRTARMKRKARSDNY